MDLLLHHRPCLQVSGLELLPFLVADWLENNLGRRILAWLPTRPTLRLTILATPFLELVHDPRTANTRPAEAQLLSYTPVLRGQFADFGWLRL
jgi:hypothetical protein